MGNKEGYKDPTADIAIHRAYYTRGKLDYTKFNSYDELKDYIMQRYKIFFICVKYTLTAVFFQCTI